jgi:hypothetical protein
LSDPLVVCCQPRFDRSNLDHREHDWSDTPAKKQEKKEERSPPVGRSGGGSAGTATGVEASLLILLCILLTSCLGLVSPF